MLGGLASGQPLWVNRTAVASTNHTLSSAGSHTVRTFSSSDRSHTKGLGDYVALGLGLASLEKTASSTPGSSISTLAFPSSSIVAVTGATASLGQVASGAMTAHGTHYLSASDEPQYNATRNGSCWAQWTAFWSSSASSSKVLATWTQSPDTYTYYAYLDSSSTALATTTITVSDGNFAVKTYVTTVTNTLYNDGLGSATTTETFRGSLTTGTITRPAYGNLHTPSCALPSFVPQCQSSWEFWASRQYLEGPPAPTGCTGTHPLARSCSSVLSSYTAAELAWDGYYRASGPPCTQASVGGGVCEALRGHYLEIAEEYYEGGVVGDTTTYISANGSVGTTVFWPTHTSFAPGCTLGCGGCQVSGRRVQLL